MEKAISIFMMILFLGSYSSAQSSEKIEEAKACFENYVKALKEGDEEKAKEYWNRKEKERYKIYDWQLRDMFFRKVNLESVDYKIRKVEETDGYIIIHVDWYYPEDSSKVIQKDVRYFIREDKKMVGANPIFILTRDWLKKESKHFVYHFKTRKDEPDQKLLDKMDNFYEKIVNFLDVDYQDRIDYFRCDSAKEVGGLFNLERSLARCDMINGVVAGIQNFVPHEIVHVISFKIMSPEEERLPETYLNEGLAYYLGGATFFSSDTLLSWAKTKILKDPKVSLDSLVLRTEKYQGNEGAALMSSLVKFLIENYGLDKFKKLYSLGKTYDQRIETLEDIYGETTKRLEKKWKNFVLSLH
ncbi:MAG: hypothetical protein MUO91_07445 [candidate division Zixibacteria bacterium]|nr:hypothetical protein [candidate division Zixibacteria bacterium]